VVPHLDCRLLSYYPFLFFYQVVHLLYYSKNQFQVLEHLVLEPPSCSINLNHPKALYSFKAKSSKIDNSMSYYNFLILNYLALHFYHFHLLKLALDLLRYLGLHSGMVLNSHNYFSDFFQNPPMVPFDGCSSSYLY
jgi:hypothetical protein